MTRAELMQATLLALTRQNTVGGGSGSGGGVFSTAFKYTIQGGGDPSLARENDGRYYLTKQGTYNAYYTFGVKIPRHARRLVIHMSTQAAASAWDKILVFGNRADYNAESNPDIWHGNTIAYATNSAMTVDELISQRNIISLELSTNNALPEQDVVLDIGYIHDEFYLEMFSANQVIRLYSIGFE